jgi:hypothetical protein
LYQLFPCVYRECFQGQKWISLLLSLQSAYRVRHKAATVNMAFVEELRKFEPKPGMAELFKEVVCDL